MEIVISVFVGLWICTASILAYVWLKKEFKNHEGEDR